MDKDAINDETIELLEPYINLRDSRDPRKELFLPQIAIQTSVVLGNITTYIRAIFTYHKLSKKEKRQQKVFQSATIVKPPSQYQILVDSMLGMAKERKTKQKVSYDSVQKFYEADYEELCENTKFTEVFCSSNNGGLYRFVIHKDFSATEIGENFSLCGALKAPMNDKNDTNSEMLDYTLLIILC